MIIFFSLRFNFNFRLYHFRKTETNSLLLRLRLNYMSENARNILTRYWGYTKFRPKQEEIIDSVLNGHDTLALMPTGGGKSLTFQVPAMVKEGLCLVVTPLIALMRDQVQHLKRLGISAAAIYSGMFHDEIDAVASGCIHGRYKFLYISPERLIADNFRDFISRLNVNLLTVDEAHCISQWGYDFRPPYLHIAEIRELFPEVPVLALTATATPDTVQDIVEKLRFKEPVIIRAGFERKNLSYNVFKNNDKTGTLLSMLKKGKGSAIVYVRSRRKTRDLAEIIYKNGISATYYHAGLDAAVRIRRQKEWSTGKVRVMVSTNAFGMGIDKPDVRQVIHYDLPDSIESYFQEAGRAGRDQKPAWASLLYNNRDITDVKKRHAASFPPIATIKKVYNQLGNYFDIPVGSGENTGYDFDIGDFARQYQFDVLETYSAIKLLEKEGLLIYSETSGRYSKLKIGLNKSDLYRYMVENPADDHLIKEILRSYAGIFTDYININEKLLAKRAGMDVKKIVDMLTGLSKKKVLSYIPVRRKPQLIFVYERLDTDIIQLSKENYDLRKKAASKRLQAILDFITSGLQCRSIQLLRYFGEKSTRRCGICDVCRKKGKTELNDVEIELITGKIKACLSNGSKHLYDVVAGLHDIEEDKVLSVIQWLLDNERISRQKDETLVWTRQLDINLE